MVITSHVSGLAKFHKRKISFTQLYYNTFIWKSQDYGSLIYFFYLF
jgi:hypothetical protein